jgi:hypothetical protein
MKFSIFPYNQINQGIRDSTNQTNQIGCRKKIGLKIEIIPIGIDTT